MLKIFAQEAHLCNYPWFWRGQFSVCQAVGALWKDNKGLQCLVKTNVTAASPIYHTFLFPLSYLIIHNARLKFQLQLSHRCQSNIFLLQPLNLCDIEGVSGISVSKEDEVNRRVDIQIKDPAKELNIKYQCEYI